MKASIIGELRSRNINVREDWVDSCLDFIGRNTNNLLESIYKQFLLSDLNEIGLGSITTALNSNASHDTIKGRHILQADEIILISEDHETRSSLQPDPQKRTLKLSLTDGKTRLFAIEQQRIHNLSCSSPVGLKLVIFGNVSVRRGLLFLSPENCIVLGGKVIPPAVPPPPPAAPVPSTTTTIPVTVTVINDDHQQQQQELPVPVKEPVKRSKPSSLSSMVEPSLPSASPPFGYLSNPPSAALFSIKAVLMCVIPPLSRDESGGYYLVVEISDGSAIKKARLSQSVLETFLGVSCQTFCTLPPSEARQIDDSLQRKLASAEGMMTVESVDGGSSLIIRSISPPSKSDFNKFLSRVLQ